MEKSLNTSAKFVKGFWVTGNLSLNNEYIIGRTCIRNGRNSVAVVTQSGSLILVPFEEIRNIKLLSIISPTIPPPITSTLYNKADITIEERLVVEVLKSINNKN